MKTWIAVSVLTFFSVNSFGGNIPYKLTFSGKFTQVNASSSECNGIFSDDIFQVNHYRTGVSGRTSVLALRGKAGSFLNGITMVGLLGYNNDFLNEKNLKAGTYSYRVVADGIVDHSFLLARVTVTHIDLVSAKTICTADAEIYAN